MRGLMREKRQECGSYAVVDVFLHQVQQRNHKRARKRKLSRPAQQNLNDKRAKRYFKLLVQGNFSKEDYFVTLTYNDSHVPNSVEEAEQEVKKYLRRIKRYSSEEIKYVVVTEEMNGDGEKVRIHHHLLVSNTVNKEELIQKWSTGRGKNRKAIGQVDVQDIKDEEGLVRLSEYIMKNPSGTRRWSSSRRLVKPTEVTNDYKYSKKKVEEIATSDNAVVLVTDMYPKHDVLSVVANYNDFLGWILTIEMRVKPEYRRRC